MNNTSSKPHCRGRKMKSVVIFFIVLGLLVFYETKKTNGNSFESGFSKGEQLHLTCDKNDNSRKLFPEYFKACELLCISLYNEKSICVSSINGGAVTCVCKQGEKE
jgi:hypothetical protein